MDNCRREDKREDVKCQFPWFRQYSSALSQKFIKFLFPACRPTWNLLRKGVETYSKFPCRVRDSRRKKIMKLHIVSTYNRIVATVRVCTCVRERVWVCTVRFSVYFRACRKKRTWRTVFFKLLNTMATCFPEHRQLLIRRARGASARVNIPLGRVLDPVLVRSVK